MDSYKTVEDRHGVPWRLEYTINSMISYEDRYGEEFLAAAQKFAAAAEAMEAGDGPATVSLRTLRAMVWCALQEHHSEITEDGAGDVIRDLGFVNAVRAMAEALALAFPPPKAPAGKTQRRSKAASAA